MCIDDKTAEELKKALKRPCPNHDDLVLAVKMTDDSVTQAREDQRLIKEILGHVREDLGDIKKELHGASGVNGIVGRTNTLSGSFNVIKLILGVVLSGVVGFGIYNVMHMNEIQIALERHSSITAHPVMEQRYLQLMSIQEQTLKKLDEHIVWGAQQYEKLSQ